MEASLTCAVCLGLYKEPVTLPLCSHNFCKSCVLEFASPANASFSASPRVVTCPLCRKINYMTAGVAALSINTTLAEVVRLLGPAAGSRREGEPGAVGGDGFSAEEESPSRAECGEHPGRSLQLYCKKCAVACCGQCVSQKHQGLFHSVNLLDIVYQEEKLTLFGSFKKLRDVHEKLSKEITDDEKDVEESFKNQTKVITSALEEVNKALDLKKQQFMDYLECQKNKTVKEHTVWQQMKDDHKKTIETLLKDCENIVDEFEPKCFLKVACDLNKRMKSSLEIIGLTCDHRARKHGWEPSHLDLQPALDAISALQITGSNPNDLFAKRNDDLNGDFSFKTITRTWKHGSNDTAVKYSPVQGQELFCSGGQMQKMHVRYVSISEIPEYQATSCEELRLKYYENSITHEHKNDIFSIPGKKASVSKVSDKYFNARKMKKYLKLTKQDAVGSPCNAMLNFSATATEADNDETKPDTENIFTHATEGCHVSIKDKAEKEKSPICLPGETIAKSSSHLNCKSPGSINNDSTAKKDATAVLFSIVGASRKPFIFRNEINNNNSVLPHVFSGKTEVTSVHKHNQNGEFCKKSKSTTHSSPATGLLGSTSSFKDTSANSEHPFSIPIGNSNSSTSLHAVSAFSISFDQPMNQTEVNEVSDMSANSALCEEFFDVVSDLDSDVEEANKETSTGACNSTSDETSPATTRMPI